MSEEKKPDYVVYDEETGTYNAALLPYSSGVAAPKITTPDITSWKQTNINKVNHEIKSKFEQLKAEYDAMVKKFEDNQLVYGAKFSFEPIVGEIYHLYLGKDGRHFLSVIAPQECNWDFVGTYRLSSEKLWEQI
ncbi:MULTISPECIES: DUF2452 domain-containing protein [Nonlabens]|uniref:GTP-binding protein n=1 Tax=Nonlabens ulvanivorans TaxID=906888 RepID=A0A084JW44_NONUL|nr:DUF2452 domain-containing protein [Nonlabens ulvanivorans]KEZ93178.1 GTP-binding protein [Nonlabens ulvanivorans]PRX13700.1 uncharacterized protein DUF2452 [Nonlabens ulvanivorans]GAK77174.1 hypothetical protein JCM19296_2779 [Nonlabens ulvanivorans]